MDSQRTGADEKTYTEEMINRYQPEVDKLVPYLPWLEEKLGEAAHKTYDSEGLAEHSVGFPVYDSTLMNFVNTANATSLMDYNYVYTYSRYRAKTEEDEYNMIMRCEILADLPDLAAVLSKYILRGMTKGNVWSDGVRNGAYFYTITRMQQILKKYS